MNRIIQKPAKTYPCGPNPLYSSETAKPAKIDLAINPPCDEPLLNGAGLYTDVRAPDPHASAFRCHNRHAL